MYTKAVALFSLAGLLVLPGCHDDCCSGSNRNDNDSHGTVYAPAENAPRAATNDTNYYDNSANAYAEGTVSSVDADGRVTLRGYESPYANSYSSYHREYYSIPESQRESRAKEMREKYKDRLTYSEYKDKERDYNFSVATPGKFTVYDESSRYGRSSDTWNYSAPRTSHYNEIKTGDRVVVGYDSKNPGSARSMYRVEAPKK